MAFLFKPECVKYFQVTLTAINLYGLYFHFAPKSGVLYGVIYGSVWLIAIMP